MKIIISQPTTFAHELLAAPPRIQKKVQKVLAQLERDPLNLEKGLDVVKLKSQDHAYRVRVDDYRLLYTQHGDQLTYQALLPRADVYRKLEIPDDEGETAEPPPLKKRRSSVKKTDAIQGLPHPLTAELLDTWRIPAEHAKALTQCSSEEALLEATIPYPVFSKVVDLLYSRTWQERLAMPSYVLRRSSDLDDLEGGLLTSTLLKLDEHQRHLALLDLDEQQVPILVRGGPGSGKSTVALYRTKHLLERFPDHHILFTTYTNALVNAIEEQLKVITSPEDFRRVKVSTLDSVAKRMMGHGNFSSEISNKNHSESFQALARVGGDRAANLKRFTDAYLLTEFFDVIEVEGCESEETYLASRRRGRKAALSSAVRKSIWQLYTRFKAELERRRLLTWGDIRKRALQALQTGQASSGFDHVLVDEAQDLNPVGLRLVAALSRSPGGLYLTADANQTLYESGFSWSALREGWPEGVSFTLERNYRNTAEVLRAVGDIKESMNEADRDGRDLSGLLEGPRPRLIVYPPEVEVDAVVQEIRERCRQTLQPLNSVAILMAGDQKGASEMGIKLEKALKSRGLNANYMSSGGLRLDANCIKILSMYAAKGLEFPVVLVMGLQEGLMPREALHLPPEEQTEEVLRDRRLFYVACSRAMQSLSVFAPADAPSEFVDDLQEDHWERVVWETSTQVT